MNVADMVGEIEAAGVSFRLDGDKVRVWYPDEQRREELAGQVALLRHHRAEVTAFLKARSAVPKMPPGVCLVSWEPEPAPVILTHYAVVTNVDRFIRTTLLELRALLAGKKWLAGHRTVRELVDRLEQCGVRVQVESPAMRQATDG